MAHEVWIHRFAAARGPVRSMRRAWAAAVLVAVATSCSGGDDIGGETDALAPDPTTDDAPSTSERSTPASDPTTTVAAAIPVGDLPLTAEIVEPDASTRCEMMGYPCDWADAPPDAMAESFALLEQVRALMIDAGEPWTSVEAAAAALRSDERVVEVLPDLEGYTGIMFRLDGAPPVFLDTELAGPIGDGSERERVAVPADVVESGALEEAAEPLGFRGARVERYHPVGGPLNPKTAVVIDPYATIDETCDDVSWEGIDRVLDWESPVAFRECRQTGDGSSEGAAVAAIFRSRPDHYPNVQHLRDQAADPAAIAAALAGADVVHLVTHGSSNCRNARPTQPLDVDLQPATYDASRCYSMVALGELTEQQRNLARAGRLTAPPGTSFSSTRWWATGDFMAGAVPQDAIVFGSHCTSADGRLSAAGLAGFVGWHKYARVSSAVDAAVRFWELMVLEGVEFDVAYSTLQDEDLHRSRPTNPDEHFAITQSATLVAGGTNPRARDVVTALLDGAELSGQVLQVDGMPGDAQPEKFPAREQQFTFDLEGVKRGTIDGVTIEVYRDGQLLRSDIDADRDGTVVDDDGEDWDTWRITPPPGAIELGNTTAADYAPGATIQLEIRAFERSSQYTADAGPVRLSTRLASVGPLPIFEELDRAIAGAGGSVEGNELRIEFETAGGPVEGAMRVTMNRGDLELGYWQLDLDGTYDPETGTMSGTLTGESRGQVGPVAAGDSGSGTWQASVDLSGGSVNGTLGVDGQSQPYTGRIESVPS